MTDACSEVNGAASDAQHSLTHEVAPTGERPAGELLEGSQLLSAIHAVDAHLGIRSETLRASTDANIPLSLGLEAVTLGAGGSGGGAHTLHEWYDPAGRYEALRRLTLLILLLAGIAPAEADSEPA